MRSAAIGSGLVHLAVLVALFAARSPAPLIVPGPDVVQVALVEPATMQPVSLPPPPEREPETKAPEIKPTEETGIKLAPPPKKKPPEKKQEPKRQSPVPTPTPAPALPYEPVGNAGLRGQVAVDAADFEFTYYLLLVRNRIAQNWTPPAGLVARDQVRAVVSFRIARDGHISGARMETGSPVEFFDRSALRAVLISDPLPPLPLGYSGGELGVHFGFEYSSP